MSYSQLHARLDSVVLDARSASKSLADTIFYYDAMVSRVANPESLWAIPAASDVLAKMALALADSRVLVESAACSCYCVEMTAFKLGLSIPELSEAEDITSAACKKIKSMESKWRSFTLGVQKVVTAPNNVQKKNLTKVVSSDLSDSAVAIIDQARVLKENLDKVCGLTATALKELEKNTLYLTAELLLSPVDFD